MLFIQLLHETEMQLQAIRAGVKAQIHGHVHAGALSMLSAMHNQINTYVASFPRQGTRLYYSKVITIIITEVLQIHVLRTKVKCIFIALWIQMESWGGGGKEVALHACSIIILYSKVKM